jgi:hypothetical protein
MEAEGEPADAILAARIEPKLSEWSVRVSGEALGPEGSATVERHIRRAIGQVTDQRSASHLETNTVGSPTTDATGGMPMELATQPIDVKIQGMAASDPQQSRLLTEAVRASLARLTGGDRAADSVSVCVARVPGDRINITAVPWYDADGVWQPPPARRDYWIVAMALDDGKWNWARLQVSNRSRLGHPTPMPSYQSEVGLSNDTAWAKEIRAENLCSGSVQSVYQPGTNTVARWMTLVQPFGNEGVDTLLFRKPGFLGIWHDVGHIAPVQYWRAFGGTAVNYTWRFD